MEWYYQTLISWAISVAMVLAVPIIILLSIPVIFFLSMLILAPIWIPLVYFSWLRKKVQPCTVDSSHPSSTPLPSSTLDNGETDVTDV